MYACFTAPTNFKYVESNRLGCRRCNTDVKNKDNSFAYDLYLAINMLKFLPVYNKGNEIESTTSFILHNSLTTRSILIA